MFGRFFDYNGDGRSDPLEIATGMGVMGLLDGADEFDDDEFDDDFDDDFDDASED